MPDDTENHDDGLDAFFDAADSGRPGAIRLAAHKISRGPEARAAAEEKPPDAPPLPEEDAPARRGESPTGVIGQLARVVVDTNDPPVTPSELDEEAMYFDDDLDGKFIAVSPEHFPDRPVNENEPFVLIPAHIHHFVPWWGWLAIGLGLAMLMAGVVFMPLLRLDRLVSSLGDGNDATARRAMRQLVMNGDERTVRKLYTTANSANAGIAARLRAIDAMALIERVPEVDRALLRLELASDTDSQVREAAIAARKQREAARTRGRRP